MRPRTITVTAIVVAALVLVVGVLVFMQTRDPMMLLFMGVPALNVVLILGAVLHVLVRHDLTGVQRLVWIAIAVFATPGFAVGAVLYLLLGPERTAALFRDLGRRAEA